MHVVPGAARRDRNRRLNRARPHFVFNSVARLSVRVLAVAALAISAYVHLHLAHRYGYPGTITGTDLFYTQGSVAALVALVLLVTGNKWVWVAAALVGLASFGAVMLYRYVDVGSIGPLPNMNDPTWRPSPDKLMSAIAEAAVVVLWLVHLALSRRPARQPGHALQPAGS